MSQLPHYPHRNRPADPPAGCAFLALLWLGIVLGFWILVAYGLWEAIQWLQRN